MSPGLWLWKQTQHHIKAKFSNVCNNLCQSPGGCLVKAAWTGRYRSCREVFRAITQPLVILPVMQQTAVQMKGRREKHCRKYRAGPEEGEGLECLRCMRGSMLRMLCYSVPVACSERCMDWEIYAASDSTWKTNQAFGTHGSVLFSFADSSAGGLPVCSCFPLWTILIFHLYPQTCPYFYSPFPSIHLGS